MIKALTGRNPNSPKPKPHQNTVMEGFIDDYGRLRVTIAVACLALILVLAFIGTVTWGGIGATALGFVVMGTHAAWGLATGVRTPRLALALDMTVLGAASLASVTQSTAGLSMTFWCVLITFLTYGRSQQAFYAYAGIWYLFLISRIPPVDFVMSIGVMFATAMMVLILLAVNRRMLMLELERSQLLGSVSHELRNQLTGVIGMIDLALDQESEPGPDEIRDLIGLAKREAVDAAGIIEDLLTSSRMESNALDVVAEPVDVDLEVARIVDHYPAEGMAIQHVGLRSGVVALADDARLRQVLRNLLSNAVRYGGKTIAISAHPDGSRVHIRVADDGPGVPPGEVETIFLPYSRAGKARRHRNSVGLGLWISRRMARAMGGDLTYSRANAQTVFEITLPAYKPTTELAPAPTAAVTD